MKRVCVLGCGRLGTIVATALAQGAVAGVALCGVCGRTLEQALALARRGGCPATDNLDGLMALRPDYVVEAATGGALRASAVSILAGGADLIVLSTGVFGDPAFWTQVSAAARRYARHVYLASGVAGGFDLMGAARLMGGLDVSFVKRKHPSASGEGDPALRTLDDHFSGSAAQAYRRFPDHLNVAVSVALATNGVEHTPVRVEPGAAVGFTTQLSGAFGRARIDTELGTEGPDLAAWSALAVLERLNSPISF